jgi:hypothetical protein
MSTKATRVPSILAALNIAALPADAQRSLAQRINGWASTYDIALTPKEKPMPKPTRVSARVKPVRVIEQEDTNDDLIEQLVKRVVAEMIAPVTTQPKLRVMPKAQPKSKGNKFFREVIVARAQRRDAEVKAGDKVVCADERCYKHGHAFINDAAHWGQHKQMFVSWYQQVYGRKATHR